MSQLSSINSRDYPLISVIIGFHAITPYTDEALQSIFCQTYPRIELILVANGLSHNTVKEELELICSKYDHLPSKTYHIYSFPIGQLSFALNFGISVSTAPYIARMDSDDISLPDRLMRQYNYLIKNQLDMVGTQLLTTDSSGKLIGLQTYPVSSSSINSLLPFKNCFAHNTILVDRVILLKYRGYIGGFSTEDYDLWLRMHRSKIVRWANMPEYLVYYRIHSNQSSRNAVAYAEACSISLMTLLLSFTPVNILAFISHLSRFFWASLLMAINKTYA